MAISFGELYLKLDPDLAHGSSEHCTCKRTRKRYDLSHYIYFAAALFTMAAAAGAGLVDVRAINKPGKLRSDSVWLDWRCVMEN